MHVPQPTRRPPQMLVAECSGPKHERAIAEVGWGRMWVTKYPRQYAPDEPWGLDNGAWPAAVSGEPWDADLFRRRRDRARGLYDSGAVGLPLLCIIPDVWGGGRRSLDLSAEWIESGELYDDWPWYLAVQDGMTPDDIRPLAPRVTGVFIGGSDRFRARWAWQFCEAAHELGLPFHYGRCGNPRMWVHAHKIGADSCDSSTPVQAGDRRFRELRRIWQQLARQELLTGFTHEDSEQ